MAKGITDTTKFIRAVLAQEIENPVNQPYTVGKAADLVAYLRTVAQRCLRTIGLPVTALMFQKDGKHRKASLVNAMQRESPRHTRML